MDFSEPDVDLTTSGSDIYNIARNFTFAISDYAESLIDEYNTDKDTTEYFVNSGSYYHYESYLVPTYGALLYATEDKQTVYMGLSFACPDDKRDDFNEDIRDFINDYGPEEVLVEPTGVTLFGVDTREGTTDDMEMMDTIVLPLSLATLAYIVGNLALMSIPVVTIISSLCLSGTLMYPVAQAMQVTQFTPSIMMSLTIAMSIDYSLFLLTRLTENLAYGGTLDQSIESMLEHAGHTVIASGTTLICCFLGFIFFPLEMLRTCGIGAGIAIASCLVVNLSLVPALMFITGDRFLKPSEKMAKLCCNEPGNPGRYRMRHYENEEIVVEEAVAAEEKPGNDAITEVDQSEFGDPMSSSSNPLSEPLIPKKTESNNIVDHSAMIDIDTEEDIEDMRNSIWYRSGSHLLSSQGPYILAALVVIMSPFCYYWVETGDSMSFDLFLPKSCDSRTAFDNYGEAFGEGSLAPYKLIFDGSEENIIVGSETNFEVMDTLISALSDPDKFPATPSLFNFEGIYSINGTEIDQELYLTAVDCGVGSECYREDYRTIATVAESKNSPYNTSTFTTVTLKCDSYSECGSDWLEDARDLIDQYEKDGKLQGYHVVLQGGASVMYDSVDDVYSCFPLMIGVTLTVVFFLVAFFFKSVTAPLRSIFTIGLTLMFCYGLVVLVYQYGWLDWLAWDSVADTGQVSWLPPVMSFSIIVGLGLDYDIFLASRVLEFRLSGYDEQSSILKGLYKTGGIITAAGTIMAIAFGGLIFASELLLNQFALYIFIAVIMDTFVVRTIMVPILMGMAKQYTWWPQQLPPETKSWDQPESLVHTDSLN